MHEIKRIGNYLETDLEDNFVNNCKYIQKDWQIDIKKVIEALLKLSPVSIIIRGSVANGTAIKGISDIDVYCFTKNAKDAKIDFNMDVKIDLKIIDYNNFLEEGKYLISKFVVATQGLCVYGIDLTKYLGDFNIADAKKLMSEDLNYLYKKTNFNIETKKKCSWYMKKLIRQGLLICLHKEKKYSRDLYLCYEAFSSWYPEKKEIMFEALKYAINPTKDVQKIIEIHEELGKFIIESSI